MSDYGREHRAPFGEVPLTPRNPVNPLQSCNSLDVFMEHVFTEPLLCVGAVSGSASQLQRRHYCDPSTPSRHTHPSAKGFLLQAAAFFCQKAFLWGMRPVKVLPEEALNQRGVGVVGK